jgi:molecular chaperone Hsp33
MIGAPAPVDSTGAAQPPETDIVQAFQLERAAVRGRLVRLGPLLDDVLARHAYPPVIEQLLAELLTATVLLASLLKYDGVFTLQVKGNGPVSVIVADVTTDGVVRGYAGFDRARLPEGADATPRALIGEGHLAFTVDQGEDTERYQGIVELDGEEVADWLLHYFEQSEQLGTDLKLAARRARDGAWRGGGLLLQRLPEDEPLRRQIEEAEVEDAWVRAKLLLDTTAEVELIDRSLAPNDLLYRLFHEEAPRVWTPTLVTRGCRCSSERVVRVLKALAPQELSELRDETGAVTATCEFCSTVYRFGEDEQRALVETVEDAGRS